MFSPKGEYMIEPHYITQKEKELPPLRVRIYTSDEKEENIIMLKEFKNSSIDKKLPYYEVQWEFEAEVPYKLEGWNNAQDLRKLDEEDLEKKVVAKFNDLKKLLNNGNSPLFFKEQEFSLNEDFKALYINPKTQEEWKSSLISFFDEQKNKMIPLENYRLKFYANGKLVTLERIDINELYYGNCALIGKVKKEEGKTFLNINRVYLMILEGEKELKIGRYYNDINVK